MVRVLFVCLGNICRSPMADAVMRQLVADAGLAGEIEVDSAGTGDWHIGDAPHAGTRAELERNGIPHAGLRARQVTREDLDTFDYVVAMDAQNLADLHDIADGDDVHARLTLLLAHAGNIGERDVPDPYYVGGFDRVYELVTEACGELLAEIREREGL